METTPIIFILGIVLIVATIFVSAAASDRDKRRINQHLIDQGATNIFISKAWTPGDRDTKIYDVAFTDSQGEQRRTRCKIHAGWLRDKEIYWEDSV